MSNLHEILRDVFKNSSTEVAVSLPRRNVTFSEFETYASAVQSLIEGKTAVGVFSTRSLEAYVTVLAAFFSGIRFVPLNPALPDARLNKIIKAGQVDVVFTDNSTWDRAAGLSVEAIHCTKLMESCEPSKGLELAAAIDPTATAYQMFTSGSTGDPKGVPIQYGNLAHYVVGIAKRVGLPKGGRYSQLFDLSFDLSIHDIFVSMSCGGAIVPASDIDLMMPHMYLQKRKIDHWFSVPLLANIAASGQGKKEVAHCLSTALFCGEALPTEYAVGFQKFLKPNHFLHNIYGPTEATIAFTTKEFRTGATQFSTVPIGTPFGDNTIAIETKNSVIVNLSEGDCGELLLGGPQVFNGYQPDVTADVFVSDKAGSRYYRSGDLVEIRSGELLHLGRKDSQIKFHGYRIELGEIEAGFRQVLGCAAAVAILKGEASSAKIVVAYVREAEIENLSALAERLPKYMLPSAMLRLEAMPTNINGKIDRRVLQELNWPL